MPNGHYGQNVNSKRGTTLVQLEDSSRHGYLSHCISPMFRVRQHPCPPTPRTTSRKSPCRRSRVRADAFTHRLRTDCGSRLRKARSVSAPQQNNLPVESLKSLTIPPNIRRRHHTEAILTNQAALACCSLDNGVFIQNRRVRPYRRQDPVQVLAPELCHKRSPKQDHKRSRILSQDRPRRLMPAMKSRCDDPAMFCRGSDLKLPSAALIASRLLGTVPVHSSSSVVWPPEPHVCRVRAEANLPSPPKFGGGCEHATPDLRSSTRSFMPSSASQFQARSREADPYPTWRYLPLAFRTQLGVTAHCICFTQAPVLR